MKSNFLIFDIELPPTKTGSNYLFKYHLQHRVLAILFILLLLINNTNVKFYGPRREVANLNQLTHNFDQVVLCRLQMYRNFMQ